jgi:hypothetical protein
VLHAEQQRREPAAMIQMQMADPYCIKVRPIESFLRHAMWRVGTAIEEQRAMFGLEPARRRGTLRMKNGSAGTENNELHGSNRKLKIEN